MKKKRFTEEQIAFALRQVEAGTSVAEILHMLADAFAKVYEHRAELSKPAFPG